MATANMPATATQPLSIEEYLRSSYHPDCDFVDGTIEERNLGEYDHNNMQAALIVWFFTRGVEWNIRAIPEQRTRVAGNRFRVPDVCLVPRDSPVEQIRITPPILCIEILSPEDRLPRVITRLNDYLAMGVPNLWLIDPIERAAFTYTREGLRLVEDSRIAIPSSPIYLDLPELFSALD